jgi:hypothetical protein
MIPTAAAAEEESVVFWWDHLDATQSRALEQMREAVSTSLADDGDGDGDGDRNTAAALRALPPSLQTDLTLLRFLKARAWDVDKALAMYLQMAAWRLEERPGDQDDDDDDANDPGRRTRLKTALRRHFPSFFHQTDRYGRPVAYRLLGRADAEALLKAMSVKQFLRLHLAQNEKLRETILPACSRAAGRPVLASTVVLDMQGFSLTKHFSPAVRAVVHLLSAVDQLNFPEHLGCMVIVNAPALFRSAWLAVRPFLDERTLRKISLVGPGEASKEALLALIPRERLPEAYGGTSRVGGGQEEGGGGWADAGPWVEEEEEGEEKAGRSAVEMERHKGGRGGSDNDNNQDDAREAMLLLPPAAAVDGDGKDGVGGNGGPAQLRRRRLLVQLVARPEVGGSSKGGSDGGATTTSSSSSGGGVARLLLRRRSSSSAATAPAAPPAAPSRHHLTVAIARRRTNTTASSAFCSPVSSGRPPPCSSFDAQHPPSPPSSPPPLQRSGSWVRVVLIGAALWHVRARRASAALERQGSGGSLRVAAALAGKLRRRRHEHAD